MTGWIILIVILAAAALLIVWGSGLPPTRPRPDSRYRGKTFMSVHDKLQRRKPK